MRKGFRLAAAAAMTGVVTAACGSAAGLVGGGDPTSSPPSPSATTPTPTPTPSGSPTPTPTGDVPAGLAQFYAQRANWSACGSYQCASVKVPLDYTDPGADTVDISLKKAPATSGSGKVGTLFINPGGPGGSGLDFVDYFTSKASPQLRSAYDIVGFDPRGVGTSDPLKCVSSSQLDTFLAYDPDPDNATEARRATALVRSLGQACEAHSGPLVAHVSTIEVAKDLDILRAAVGDATLHYYGASYGTLIGATYAQLFPDHVDRMVLDGALDPQLSPQQLNLQQAAGFETALNAYVDSCVTAASCPLGTDKQQALSKIKAFLDGLDAHPIDSGDPSRPLTEALGFYGIAVTLYDKDYWSYLTNALGAAFSGDGSQLLTLADAYWSRNPGGGYQNNSAEVIYAVNCLDDPVNVSVSQIRASQARYERVAPVFGRVFAWSLLGCSNWPVKPTQPPLAIRAAGAKPIVVVGTTRDPATPYAWAQALANQLESGVLVSRNGDGHTGFHMGNSCVDGAVDAYLVSGSVPKDGLSC